MIGSASATDIIQSVGQAGYQASPAGDADVRLSLSDLSCGHCIASVTQALEAVPGVDAAMVTLTQADIYGQADSAALIAAIQQAGYQAQAVEGAHPKSEPLPSTDVAMPETQAAALDPTPASVDIVPHTDDDDGDSVQLLLDGMSCASCVLKVQNALQAVPGVAHARVNLAERSALVSGHGDPRALISAVQKAGYGAEIIQDEVLRRARQHESAQKAVRAFRWQAAVALGLGLPLMAWGLFGGSMTLTEHSQIPWLIVGIATLAVMIGAGGHFYRNAWRSLLNGSATMDTLVALGTGAALAVLHLR